MDDRRQVQHAATMDPWDDLVREPLPREPRVPRPPRSPRMLALFGGLAVLLVVAVVGAAVVVNRDGRTPAVRATSTAPSARTTATSTMPSPTPTLAREPRDNGWTRVTRMVGDVTFAASAPQRGYLCGLDESSGTLSVGVTTDGGQTWTYGQTPAAYESCSLQISQTNALDVVVTSEEGSCAAPCPRVDAHYSSDGGKTWAAAPLPQNTVAPGGAVWAGAYLYAWAGANADNGQSGFLKVSAGGSPFVSLDVNTLLAGARNVSIGSAVAGGTTVYLNLAYTGCAVSPCRAVVASGDGGKTWTQVPNDSNVQLMYVAGNMLYGETTMGATATLWFSTDNGASWASRDFPPLPDGRPLNLGAPGASWVPVQDGIVAASPDLGLVAYLRGATWSWTVIPFGPGPDGYSVAAVSPGANGQSQRVWGVIDAQSSNAGTYWHSLP